MSVNQHDPRIVFQMQVAEGENSFGDQLTAGCLPLKQDVEVQILLPELARIVTGMENRSRLWQGPGRRPRWARRMRAWSIATDLTNGTRHVSLERQSSSYANSAPRSVNDAIQSTTALATPHCSARCR